MSDLADAQRAIEENYAGCHESVADFAKELTTDTTEIPESLAYYIDYEKMGRDMELSGDILPLRQAIEKFIYSGIIKKLV